MLPTSGAPSGPTIVGAAGGVVSGGSVCEKGVDPVTAGGLSLALLGAELLAEHAVALLAGSALARRRFERARGRAVSVHRWLGASVLALAGSPRMADAARRALRLYPSAMRGLVGLAGGA